MFEEYNLSHEEVDHIIKYYKENIDESLDSLRIVCIWNSPEDLAKLYARQCDCVIEDLFIAQYMDYESLGRDLIEDNIQFCYLKNNRAVEFEI